MNQDVPPSDSDSTEYLVVAEHDDNARPVVHLLHQRDFEKVAAMNGHVLAVTQKLLPFKIADEMSELLRRRLASVSGDFSHLQQEVQIVFQRTLQEAQCTGH